MLGVALAVSATGALANRQLGDRRADLAHVQRAANAAEARASALQRYSEVAALSKARIDTVGGLLHGRFDWARSLRDVARAVPSDVPLISLVGTVSPTSAVEGAGGSSMRGALPVPAVDLIGCAKSQTRVAELIGRLRRMHGVQRVSLASAEKSESTSANATDCRATDNMPQFQLTIFYDGLDGIVPLARSGASQAAAARRQRRRRRDRGADRAMSPNVRVMLGVLGTIAVGAALWLPSSLPSAPRSPMCRRRSGRRSRGATAP